MACSVVAKKALQAFQSVSLKWATTSCAERKRKTLGFITRVSCGESVGWGNQTQYSVCNDLNHRSWHKYMASQKHDVSFVSHLKEGWEVFLLTSYPSVLEEKGKSSLLYQGYVLGSFSVFMSPEKQLECIHSGTVSISSSSASCESTNVIFRQNL